MWLSCKLLFQIAKNWFWTARLHTKCAEGPSPWNKTIFWATRTVTYWSALIWKHYPRDLHLEINLCTICWFSITPASHWSLFVLVFWTMMTLPTPVGLRDEIFRREGIRGAITARWRHQMETFSVLLAICAGNSPVTAEFPAQRPVTRIFDVSFDLCPNKRLNNNGEAGDLRRHRTHYDVIVMCMCCRDRWDSQLLEVWHQNVRRVQRKIIKNEHSSAWSHGTTVKRFGLWLTGGAICMERNHRQKYLGFIDIVSVCLWRS